MNLEDRIKRRLVIEDVDSIDALTGRRPQIGCRSADIFVRLDDAVRVAALEAEDTANPIAVTAIVRKDAVTEIAPPDVEALLAAFHTPEEDQ